MRRYLPFVLAATALSACNVGPDYKKPDTTLPADYQEVIILRNLERLPFDEIAERLGRSRPAVQMLWMRAIRKLQEIVAADHSTPGSPA